MPKMVKIHEYLAYIHYHKSKDKRKETSTYVSIHSAVPSNNSGVIMLVNLAALVAQYAPLKWNMILFLVS